MMQQRMGWIGIQIGIFLIFLTVAFATYPYFLTNEFTPGGDGSRIYPYLKYMEKVPEHFPFWQAHKHHGYPLLADPENHMPLSLILNTESSHFNIHLNLVFFCLTATFAFILRSLARTLGLSQTASLCVGLVTIFGNIGIIRAFFHGAFNVFLYQILAYAALLVLLFVMLQKRHIYLILFIPVLLAGAIPSGYYFPIIFHAPAFILMMCMYARLGQSPLDSAKRTFIVLTLISIVTACVSMHLLLPLLDGVYLSGTFTTATSTIEVSDRDIYNYYFGLWPFVLLALLFARGMFKRYAKLFLAMAGINFVLILLNRIGFDAFFDFWAALPVLKNIRHQLIFSSVSSIAAAFCAGIFIDVCKEGTHVHENRRALIIGCILLLVLVAYLQFGREMSWLMIMVTMCFVLMPLFRKRFYVVLGLFVVMSGLMAYNLKASPVTERFHASSNKISFKDYNGPYSWWNFYGYDRFTPYFRQGHFSMVFLQKYRLLLSLLYDQEITAQRPHWITSIDNVQKSKQRPEIARLMGIQKPACKKWESPFRVYDSWVVADEAAAADLMKSEGFKADGPIILAEPPGITPQKNIPLQAVAELTGKSAETLSLQVSTNKNSVVLIPEIYHRNWEACVDGERTRVIRAYGSMRAVCVPAGEHEIVLRFVYMPFWWGAGISFAALMLSIVLVHRYKNALYEWITPAHAALPAATNDDQGDDICSAD